MPRKGRPPSLFLSFRNYASPLALKIILKTTHNLIKSKEHPDLSLKSTMLALGKPRNQLYKEGNFMVFHVRFHFFFFSDSPR